MLIKYQLKAERVLPELYRAAGNKLCCHLIILSDCDLQKNTMHICHNAGGGGPWAF